MNEDAAPLICPICGAALVKEGQAWQCGTGHSFDIAREGYVNLLVLGHKKPEILGDSAEMLAARRKFLDQGHYQPLSDFINQWVYQYAISRQGNAPEKGMHIADIGCGEGYYLGSLKHHLDRQAEKPKIGYFGMDVSKAAIKLAAKRYQDMGFLVADTRKKIVFADHSIQVLLNIFAPRNMAEFDRILAENGVILVVIPGSHHLEDLRSLLGLLEIEPDKRERIVEQFAGHFKLVEEHAVRVEMRLSTADLLWLAQMTPGYWHAAPEVWSRIASLPAMVGTADFEILMFSR